MRSKLTGLALVIVLILLAALPGAAAPLAGPCTPGASYNSACDANQDGQITVADVQLTAGHWNQSGVFVSDNNHTHLGQSWTGASNPLKFNGAFGAPDYAPLVLNNTAGHGLAIPNASVNGIYVGTTGAYGVVANDVAQDGFYVGTAGNPSSAPFSGESNGFEVAGAEGSGLYVGRADGYGVYIASAGLAGVNIHNTDRGVQTSNSTTAGFTSLADGTGFAAGSPDLDGLAVQDAGRYGVYVMSADGDGVNSDGNLYGGYFWGNIYVDGNCVGCLQANFAVNAGDRPLQPGDVVSVEGVISTGFDAGAELWQAAPAQPGQAVAGVVAGRAELVTVDGHRPAESGRRLVPREGVAQPGEYVTVVYSGPMQVRVAPGEGALAAGARLTAAANGQVRPLGVLQVQLAGGAGTASMSEDAPIVGVALDAPKDGLVWVLVNPQ